MKVIKKNISSERDAIINAMYENIDSQDEPEVGIFWYDTNTNSLFGVCSTPSSDRQWYKSNTFNDDVRTDKRLHQSVWKREFFKGNKKFTGDYTKVPRGRVFEFKHNGFVVFTGSWINDYPSVKDDILKAFNLPEDNTTFRIDEHWEIGHGWSQEFI